MSKHNRIALALKGAAMGIAEAIPGVSGGTIAFITGIYQELLETIKSFTPQNIMKLAQSPKAFWSAINGPFLLVLLIGMVLGLGSGVIVITSLLEHSQHLLWAFFFGLVLASAYVLGKDLDWNAKMIILAVLGAALSYCVTILTPADGSEHPMYLFMAGVIAISALMLPGVSGSFMLLLFGLYHTVMLTIKSIFGGDLSAKNIAILASFAAGALVGMFTFARVLSYLFKHYAKSTMAVMIGILIGSLNKLWPWKMIETALNKATTEVEFINHAFLPDDENYKTLNEINIGPEQYQQYGDPQTLWVIAAFLLGIAVVLILSKLDTSKENQ